MANKPKRGRTANLKVPAVSPTKRHTENEHRTQVSRSVNAGAGTRRGDRRDTHPTYTGNKKHSARGNTPRANVATRKN